MTLSEFQTWALAQGQVGKATDGGYVGQCVSLINQYLSKVHGINAGAWGDAAAWAKPDHPIRQWFTPVNQSQPGDIGVYTGGQYGHIFIYTASGILEQNGRTPLRVTASPDRNATVILRPKAGMPQAQGGTVNEKPTIEQMRYIHVDSEGWDWKQTMAGKFDQLFKDSWGWRPLSDLLADKWSAKNDPWRAKRQAALDFYATYSSTIAELSARPSKAELEAANAKIAEQAKLVEAANKALADAQAKSTEDTKLLNDAGSLWSRILARLFKK